MVYMLAGEELKDFSVYVYICVVLTIVTILVTCRTVWGEPELSMRLE